MNRDIKLQENQTASRRNHSRGENTRRQITEVLIRLLEEKNLWDIKVTDITRELGITSQSFYKHFRQMDDVLAAHKEVILKDMPDFKTLFSGEWNNDNSVEHLTRVIEATLEFWDKHRAAMRVMNILNDVNNENFLHFRRIRGTPIAAAFRLKIDDALDKGRLSKPLDADLASWSMVARLMTFGETFPYMLTMGYRREDLIETTARMFSLSLGYGR
ncbi:MAG: TetR/AcrR family transcriptional regulator [bacterium]